MNVIDTIYWRYSTKSFDKEVKISEADLGIIKTLLRMSPSSINIQPWHFLIIGTDEGKERMIKGAQGFFSINESKILNASHIVLFCAKTSINEEYLQHIIQKESEDGRFPNEEVKQQVFGGRKMFVDLHITELKDLQDWTEKQVYLNMGNFLIGVAALGIDACPIEGIDVRALDNEFELLKQGYRSVAAIALGYRKEDDFNIPSITPKSRLDDGEIITII